MLTGCALEASSLRIALVYAQYGSRTCFQTSCKVTNHARFQPRVIFFYFQQMNVKMGHPSHHSTRWRSIRFLTGGFQPLKTKTKPVSGWELLFQQTHNSHPLCFGFFFWLTELAWRGKYNRINQIKVKKEKKKGLQICVSEHCFSLFLSIVSLSQIYSVIVWRGRPRGN